MTGSDRNLAYYETPSAAREDYWRYMAAPRHRVRRILGLVRAFAPETLVDLGCGGGHLLEELRGALPRTAFAGVDLSPRQIAENRTRVPQIEWRVADLQQAVAGGSSFDVVVASEVIEHLDHPSMLLRNALGFARSGGALVLTTQSGPLRETERRVGHVRHFDREEMTGLLELAGWRVRRIWNEGFPFHDLSKWWANRDPDASMSRFGSDRAYGPMERSICLALRAAFRLSSRRHGAQLFAVASRPE